MMATRLLQKNDFFHNPKYRWSESILCIQDDLESIDASLIIRRSNM